jgi:hypothetical protein
MTKQQAESQSFEKFSGAKLDYLAFREAILSAASNFTEIYAEGLLGPLLQQAEYSTYFPEAPFEPLANPGTWTDRLAAIPALPVVVAPLIHTPQQVAASNASLQRELWKEEFDAWTDIDKAERQFSNMVIKALDRDTIESIKRPGVGLAHLTLKALLKELDKLYDTYTAGDMALLANTIQAKYNLQTTPIRHHINAYRLAFQHYSRAGQAQPNSNQVLALARSFDNCHALSARVQQWLVNEPALANQTFAKLAADITTFVDTNNIISLSPTISDIETSAQAQRAQRNNGRNPGGGRGGQRKKIARPLLYCWSHGQCGHSSQDCTNKQAGHRDDSNETNHRGGREGSWQSTKYTNPLPT